LKNISAIKLLLSSLLLATSLSAVDFTLSVGVHDFVVSDIKNDVATDGINAGTSHTLGLNTAIYLTHKMENGISILAKAEAFLDHDTDHLDPDHIPVWFDFLIDIDGPIYSINENDSLKWYVLMDNRQNTVSCIEREVRQHIGIGYEHIMGNLILDFNAYAGFYYIEFDDDTPVARGYNRQPTDDGEASNVLEIKGKYDFNQNWSLYAKAKRYAANTGMEKLEDNLEALLTYKGKEFLSEGASLNLKVKYAKYNLDRFFVPATGVAIVPFDNDTLIQAYITLPIEF
jgi:hypothetical protein